MKVTHAHIITIGDEILYGQIVDTNSQWIGIELGKIGVKVVKKTSVGDTEKEILYCLGEAEKNSSIIIITGGLGPTPDDITRNCLAKYFDCELTINDEALSDLLRLYNKYGKKPTEKNRRQAMLPSCCSAISNSLGTASGMWFDRRGKVFISLPGVPYEMKLMMTSHVIPKLKKRFSLPFISHVNINTAGLAETTLAKKLEKFQRALPKHISLAFLPRLGEVRLRLTAMGESKLDLKNNLNSQVKKLESILDNCIYSYDEVSIEMKVGNILRSKKMTLAVAESCTGGYLSHLITTVPGSSDYFLGSIIPYSYDVKMRQLGVKPETLEKYGAVSEPTIIEMANIVRAKFNTDIGVASSGIAGPGGATADKAVGMIWIAYSDKFRTVTKKLQLSDDRLINIQWASRALLNLIRISLPIKARK